MLAKTDDLLGKLFSDLYSCIPYMEKEVDRQTFWGRCYATLTHPVTEKSSLPMKS